MSYESSRKPRCVGATATHLNAGLWGSRFVGYCRVGTNGQEVWLEGHRVPVWMAWARMASYVAFLPVGFQAGLMVGQTITGGWGYPPYYYLASTLLTFLLVVLGLWGSGIWNESLGSYEIVVWPVAKGRTLRQAYGPGATPGRALWMLMNTFLNVNDLVQLEVPIGPEGRPRRLVLRTRDTGAESLTSVLSGVYYGQESRNSAQRAGAGDPWNWSRN